MPSDRFDRWARMLAASDQNLMLLGGIALAVVVGWQLTTVLLPDPWAQRVRLAFLVVSAIVVAEMVSGLHPTTNEIILGGFGVAIVAAVMRRYWPRPLPDPVEEGQ